MVKTIFASLLAIGLLTGAASAKAPPADCKDGWVKATCSCHAWVGVGEVCKRGQACNTVLGKCSK